MPRGRAWLLTALISVVALVNYFDRQSLSIVAPRFQAELHLSDAGYGHIVSLFLFASAIAYALAGLVADWLGTRTSMAVFVGWWSAAEAVTAFVRSTFQLGAARFCLGLGEPGLWVAAPKAIGEIFPRKDRSLAVGIYTLGSTVGAVVALPIIAYVTIHYPWKWIFLIDGVAGLLWLPFWYLAYPRHTHSTQPVAVPAPRVPQSVLLKQVLSSSKTWRLTIARGLTDPVWYFYLFWFPKYMLGSRGLSLDHMAQIGWLVYLFAGIGTVLGGAFSSLLISRGQQPARAYRTVMLICAILVPISPLAGLVPSALVCVLVASVVAFAHMAWLVNLTATVVELFPPAQVGRAFGIIAAGSGFGGMISSEVIGWVVMHSGYLPLFFLMMLLHPIALALLWPTFREGQAPIGPA
ncbi:MAG: MFS transporter [Terracidiphilus sp.]|nr:MFS transporter [Terracidiphilus sp.]